MRLIISRIVVAALAVIPVAAIAEPLTKEAVLQLTQLNLGDDAIVAKIQSDKVDFDVSTGEMIELKQKGVSSPVIAAMISNRFVAKIEPSLDSPDPRVPHPAGLYALHDDAPRRMQKMEPTVSNQAKTGGILGYALTGGIASMSVKASIQQETSRVPVSAQPQFFFFSAESNGNDSAVWANGSNTVVSSPAELTLVRLTKKSGRREARVGSMNLGGAKTGVMDKDRLEFSHRLIRPGVYEIDVSKPLPVGEYGFIYSLSGGGANGAMTARVFDFTVH